MAICIVKKIKRHNNKWVFRVYNVTDLSVFLKIFANQFFLNHIVGSTKPKLLSSATCSVVTIPYDYIYIIHIQSYLEHMHIKCFNRESPMLFH